METDEMSDTPLPTFPETVRQFLQHLGEDPEREGLLKTPERVAESYGFLTRGYGTSIEELLGGAIFHEQCDEMVIVKDIEVYSLCEHHLLPFVGRAHVAYIPDGRIVGLSKIPRLVDMFSRRLQVQERMTTQIARALQEVLSPLGVAVVIEADHLCMMMRGVEKQNSRTVTSCMLGAFKNNDKTRAEFLNLVRSMRR
jgi:GTP cyclohydrolase I